MTDNIKPHGEARLILRLPSDYSQPVLWLWSQSNHRRQGSLAAGENDPELMQLLATYPAWVLVPASECVFHQVTLPHRARYQSMKVLPFILEEQLATDVEHLHFAILQQVGEVCDVAVVAKSAMQQWIVRCELLGVRIQALLPDVLMLPLSPNGWSAICLNEQWLFRSAAHAGMAVESSWLPDLLAVYAPPLIVSYSPPPVRIAEQPEWREQPPQDLLQLAAEGEIYRGADLRQGVFTRSSSWRVVLRPWRPVMLALAGYLLLLGADSGLSHYRLWQQSEYWHQETVRVYQQLFPAEKNVVNPRAQMQQHLQQLKSAAQIGLGVQIGQLQQLVAEDPAIRLQALSYDAGRNELKINLHMPSFEALEQFQNSAGRYYRVQPGEAKQVAGGVESRLALGIKHE